MADMRLLRMLATLTEAILRHAQDGLLVIAVCVGLAFLASARPVAASAPHPERSAVESKDAPPRHPSPQSPTPPPPPPSGDGNPITQVINQIIQFPFQNLVEALQNAAQSMLNGTITPLETFFSASIGRWLTSSPGIITPGGGIANGDDVMGPAWRLMVKVAVLLWPLTLALIAAIAAKDAVAAASWGIGDLKEALGGWLLAVVFSATSLYWMDLANRFTNATTMTILNMSFTGEAGFQPNALTTLVFGTAGLVLTLVSMPASLIIVIFVILMGLATLSALIFQFLARFVILYLLVALAPVIIILGVLPPLGWFRYMWLRGFIMVEAIGPINALLLKFVMILAVRGASNDPMAAFVNFIGAIGVLSILLTVDGVIITGVFGAAEEVMQKAVSTVTTLGTLAVAGVTALAGGSIAAGAGGTAAAGAAGTGGSAGGASAGAAAASSASAASSAARAGASGAGSPASIARHAFNPGAALRGAGDVLFRQPGMLGSFGAGMRSLGGAMEQRDREEQSQARWEQSQAGRGGSTAGGKSAPGADGTGSSPRPRNPSSSPTGGAAPSHPPSQDAGALSHSQSHLPTAPASTANSVEPNAPKSAGSPMVVTSRADAAALAPDTKSDGANPAVLSAGQPLDDKARNGAAPIATSVPPLQTPSVSPMGIPLAASSAPLSTTPARPILAQEAANVVGTLPNSLGERAGAFAQ